MNWFKYDSLKQQRITQHEKQNNIISDLQQFKCHEQVNRVLFDIHKSMIDDGLVLMKASLLDTVDIVESQMKSRDTLLQQIEKSIQDKIICRKDCRR